MKTENFYGLPRLMYISDGATLNHHYNNIKLVLDGGLKWVQLRVKNIDSDPLLDFAYKVQELCVRYDVLLSINDHLDIALKILSDGIHLGKEDMALSQAKQLMSNNMLLGASTNNIEDIVDAYQYADYVGLGPFAFTSTKSKLKPILGLSGISKIVLTLRDLQVMCPIYAIGGIKLNDTMPLLEAGVHGIAVSSGLINASNSIQNIETWVNHIEKYA